MACEMRILAIETSTDRLGVAVVDEAQVLASFELLAERPHAAELPQAVERVLSAAGATLADLDGFAIDIGPGSFTGLRIGLAFVKALAFCHRKPVIGVPSLDVLAAQLPFVPQSVCPIIDAKRRQVYTARYRLDGDQPMKQSEYELLTIEHLLQSLPQEPVVFSGSGVPLYAAQLRDSLGDRAQFSPAALWWPQAGMLGMLGLRRMISGKRDNPDQLIPLYLYPMTCSVRLQSGANLALK